MINTDDIYTKLFYGIISIITEDYEILSGDLFNKVIIHLVSNILCHHDSMTN